MKQWQSRSSTNGNSKSFGTLNINQNLLQKTKNFTEENKLLGKAPTTERLSYAEILKATKNPSIRTSKTNFNDYKSNKNIHKKLPSLTSIFRTRKQNIPSNNNSNTNMSKNDKYQQKINKLK